MNRIFPWLLALLIIGLTLLAFGEEASSGEEVSSGEEGVLLRYRLDPGDVQVFEAEAKLDMKATATQGGQTQNATTAMAIHMPFSLRGTATGDDGTMQAEVAIHGFDIDVDIAAAGQRMTMSGDERGLEVKQNGTTVISGDWGSANLGQFPDLRQLLDLKMNARFNDRGELVELGGLDTAPAQLQGFDLSQALDNQVVYPEQAVKPGDSWTHELTQKVVNPALPGGKITLKATMTYTVLERATYRNRDCLKLKFEADFTNPDTSSKVQLQQAVDGTAYIDIATGVPLDCRLKLTQRMDGTIDGVKVGVTGGGTVKLSYAGGQKRYDELVHDLADAAGNVLGTLSVPMVTEKTITIGEERYAKGDVLNAGGEQYRVVAFRSTALKLHRVSDSAVYQLGLGAGGRVTYVKLLGFAD
jgi:hypothetical protein